MNWLEASTIMASVLIICVSCTILGLMLGVAWERARNAKRRRGGKENDNG